MPTGNLKDIAAQRPEDVRFLGLDLGTKTIGLAVSDTGQRVATPLRTVRRTSFRQDMAALADVVREYEIGGYVFGWPLNMDGSAGPSCERVRSFIDEMRKSPPWDSVSDPWIALWDERLSTEAVDDFLVNTVDMSRAKRKIVVDKLAAQVILQGALDFIRAGTER